jgi:hypothetical protein
MLIPVEDVCAPEISDSIHTFPFDFIEAADFHSSYHNKLINLVSGGAAECGQIPVIASMCECRLWRWLQGVGKNTFGHLPSFHALADAHIEFHYAVEMILFSVRDADFMSAEVLLRNEFLQATRQILTTLNELHGEIYVSEGVGVA